MILFLFFFLAPPSYGNEDPVLYFAGTDGDLSIEPVAAYNFAVDSNDPENGPRSAHVALKVCNNGLNTMNDVVINIGDFIASTPGEYRERTVSESTYSGTFSFEHSGDCDDSDGTREIGDLAAGECSVQYWLIEYPVVDNSGNSVAGQNTLADDLWLEYDGWATANDGGAPLAVDTTWRIHMRSMLSASANKAWPNNDNAVPEEYLQIFEDSLGWRPDTSVQIAGCPLTIEGIWYQTGNINKGFDNDGDFVPDYNLFLQTIGNPSIFDPCCFRLVKTYGVLIISLSGGGGSEQIITFTDQLYHTNLPPNNNGAVGLVYYQYVPMSAPCSGLVTPYQTVASGNNNEKYSGDFGVGVGGPTSSIPDVNLEVIGPDVASYDSDIEFEINLKNNAGKELGAISFDIPLVISDSIPEGTVYIAGSAAANNTFPPYITTTIYYSTDNGQTWTTTEPPAALVTDIEWRLDQNLPYNDSISVTFAIQAPSLTYTLPYVIDEAAIRIGNGDPFLFAYDTVLLKGDYMIGDTIFLDDGGISGIRGDGIRDPGEPGIDNIEVFLFYDASGDSIRNTGDILLTSVSSGNGGFYSFDSLPNSNYLVLVNIADPDLPGGSAITTGDPVRPVQINGSSNVDIDYGFIPPIRVDKNLTSADTSYEGQFISFSIDVYNEIVTNETLASVYSPSTVHNTATGSDWTDPDNSTGFDDGTVSVLSNWKKQGGGWPPRDGHLLRKEFDPFTPCGNIVKVEGVFDFELTMDMQDDHLGVVLYQNDVYTIHEEIDINLVNLEFSPATDYYFWDITQYVNTWAQLDQMMLGMWAEPQEGNGWDGTDMLVDAIFARITVDDPSCGNISSPFDQNTSLLIVPMTDTYDPTQMDFLYANVSPDSVNETTGYLHWDNLGLLDAGQVQRITVTFEGLEPTVEGEIVANVATVDSAQFSNGLYANMDSDTATTVLYSTGSIGDSILNSNTGFGIPYVQIILTADIDLTLDGIYYPAGSNITTQTDSGGFYLFDGLLDGNFVVTVDTNSIPGSAVQTYDPDGTLDNMTAVTISGANDFLTADFAYNVPNAVRGNVLNDVNKDGSPDSPEPGIPNVTIQLMSCGGDACFDSTDVIFLTIVTDSLGNFEFGDLPDDEYYVVVDTSTLPPGAPLDYWTARFDPDGSIPPDNISQSFILVGGTFQFNLDFGFSLDGPNTITGTVYEDWNADTLQNFGIEGGIAGISISAYYDVDTNGIFDPLIDPLVETDITDASGAYLFTVLADGTYFIIINNPPPYVQLEDPDGLRDNRTSILITGTSVSDVDFGYYPIGPADMGDLVWFDTDGDEVADFMESGIPNISIQLWSDLDNNTIYNLVAIDTSDSFGNYLFTDLPDGIYRVFVDSTDTDLPVDSYGEVVIPTTSTIYDVVISSGVVVSLNGVSCTGCDLSMDFGFANPGAIGDQLYFDNNGNATQDLSEFGIAGVRVFLCEEGVMACDAVTALAMDTTDATGNYLFTGLYPGTYVVAVDVATLPSGMGSSNMTGDPDRDGVPCNDNTFPSLPSCDDQAEDNIIYFGSRLLGVDFGYKPPGVIGDLVWIDYDGDGEQDSGEPGLPGFPVQIDPPGGVDLGNGVGVPVLINTDTEGNYSFGNLPDGTYVITIIPLAGFIPIYDADGVADNTTTVIISGGIVAQGLNSWCSDPTGCDLDIDFGYQLNGTNILMGTVCMDDNSEDGICSTGGETLLENTAMYLYNDDALFLGSVFTDSLGKFSFSGLPDDTYIISMSTSPEPFSLSRLTTDASDTPASSITETPTSVYQTLIVSSSLSGIDYAYFFDESVDFGDLPSPYSSTLNDLPTGAYHIQPIKSNLYLGTKPDVEIAPVLNVNAQGDDITNLDDEDGISFINPNDWMIGASGGTIQVSVFGSGYLVGWMDFNLDGDFTDPSEMIANQSVSTGVSTIFFDIPAGTDLSNNVILYSRFRLFGSQPGIPQLAYSGSANNGEVEDYALILNVSRNITPNLFLTFKLKTQ